jgi:hypothetical protein
MSNAASFLDKVYEQQTSVANELTALKEESKNLQDLFMQYLQRMWQVQQRLNVVAKVADDHCAEIYNHMEGAIEEVV